MVTLMSDLKIDNVNAHMCRCGMTSEDEDGLAIVNKPKRFLTNSKYVKDQ